MRVDQFDFDLPEERIALRPAQPRDSARMLVVGSDGRLTHAQVRDLPDFLHPGDALVLNDTRVIRARLRGVRRARAGAATEPRIEVTLHKRIAPDRFLAFAKPARKLEQGDRLALGQSISATVARRGDAGEVELHFALGAAQIDRALAVEGEIPLPPYIAGKRATDDRDAEDYQTIFAREAASVAAPTAGLHFTPELFSALDARGIAREAVTLHVGAGTFLPVSAEDTQDHKMHSEWAHLGAASAIKLNRVRESGGRVAAAGTTSLRTLESAADASGRLHAFEGETDIFITPGYQFRAVDILLTNFHLPRSTLFMLVSAFSGLETMKAAYAEAIRENYRFYSYGDACLLFRQP
jgi:S-adenosylmethionine:tRNA ribosyltransferase-isomerase